MHKAPLLPEEIPAGWLESANQRYRLENIPPKQRPILALSDLSKELQRSIRFDSEAAKVVFEWFESRSKPGSHYIGALFTGAFYFDASFWSMTIPVFYGRVQLSPIDSLDEMPEALRDELQRDRVAGNVLVHYWAHCFDYALGFAALRGKADIEARLKAFFSNGDSELRGAIAQLLTLHPNPKAVLGFRLATEIFLKAFIVHLAGLPTDELRKSYGHDLRKLADKCYELKPLPEFQILEQGVGSFPANMGDRYDGNQRSLPEVFDAAFIAQFTAATVVRQMTGQDIRNQIWAEKGEDTGKEK